MDRSCLYGKIRILSGGNVGIGTSTPLKKLVVTTGNNTNSSNNKSDALAYFGGGNDNADSQNISFPNPSITDGSIPGMSWWSPDVMFGRYKFESFWSIKETHGGALGNSQKDIIRAYFYDSGGFSYIDKVIIPNGNVGIGNTAPSQILHVTGNIRVTGAYYDSANAAGTSGQILSSTGTGTSWIAATGGSVTGSGTTNYVPKWTSASAIGDSAIYDNAGNVGIGTTGPLGTLDIGKSSATPSLVIGNSSYPSTYNSVWGLQGGAQSIMIFGNNGQNEIRAGSTGAGGLFRLLYK